MSTSEEELSLSLSSFHILLRRAGLLKGLCSSRTGAASLGEVTPDFSEDESRCGEEREPK